MTTTQQVSKPLPKRNTGEIRGFEKQVSREGRVKTAGGYHASIHTWMDAERNLRHGRTYFYVGNSETVPDAPVSIEYEMEEYEVTLPSGETGMKERLAKDSHGQGIVKSISLVSPTEWFAYLMKGTYHSSHSRQVPRKDDDGNVMKYQNGETMVRYESYTTEHPITIQHIIGRTHAGVYKLISDLTVMVTGRQGYPFINYITSGNNYHSNCRFYGASTPWGKIQGGDRTKNYEYNTNYYKRNRQVQVMGELDEAFMENYNAWMALSEDLAALANVGQIENLKKNIVQSKRSLEDNENTLTRITAKWTDEYMMQYARREREKQIAGAEQQIKYSKDSLERSEKNLKTAQAKETTSVTALQKAHFGKVFRKAKVTNDADN